MTHIRHAYNLPGRGQCHLPVQIYDQLSGLFVVEENEGIQNCTARNETAAGPSLAVGKGSPFASQTMKELPPSHIANENV